MTVDEYLDQFVRRIIVDALNEATATYWQHTARQLEAACWRPGDFTGHATGEDLTARDRRLHEAAQACRAKGLLAVETFGGEL